MWHSRGDHFRMKKPSLWITSYNGDAKPFAVGFLGGYPLLSVVPVGKDVEVVGVVRPIVFVPSLIQCVYLLRQVPTLGKGQGGLTLPVAKRCPKNPSSELNPKVVSSKRKRYKPT